MTSILACAFASMLFIRGCGLSIETALLIETGMAKETVVRIAGKPHRVDSSGDWIYDVWRFKTMVVAFDDKGFVIVTTF